MKEREALKLALEAAYLAGFNASDEGYNGEYPFGDKMQDPAENRVWKKDRDNYLKEALAQTELCKYGQEPKSCTSSPMDCQCALDATFAQPEQEPVAWRGYNWGHSPDDWVYRDFDDPILDGNGNNVGQPLYTAPPQRTWVGLTDEEWQEIADKYNLIIWSSFKQDIEAKLKEKNT